MAGAWERELRARRLRAAAERWDVERERAEAVERARQAAMARREVVPPTQVVPEVRQAAGGRPEAPGLCLHRW